MPLQEENLASHLGNVLDTLEGRVSAAVMEHLKSYNSHTTAEFYLPVIDYFFLAHHLGGKSHADLAKEIGIGKSTVRKIFVEAGLPAMTRKEALLAKMKNPEYAAQAAELSRKRLQLQKQDPEFAKTHADATREELERRWADPKTAARIVKGVQDELEQRWKDPKFREKFLKGHAAELEQRWKSAEFRKSFAEAQDRGRVTMWQDSAFKQKIAEASQDARYRPEGLVSKVHIPSIHGYRRDIRFYAQSMWEANFARVLIYSHAMFSWRNTFKLRVPGEYRKVIGSEKTELTIDFIVRNARGRVTLYEIMAHPLEKPEGVAKLELLRQQFPQLKVVVVDPEYYNGVRKNFAAKINASGYLCGWETRQDNLRTNPAKYA